MKKILLAGIAATAFSGAPTIAADMPVKGPPVAAPVFNGTSGYLGANVGWSGHRAEVFDQATSPPTSVGSHSGSGLAGGGQTGCDYQAGQWVFGISGMFDGADVRGHHNDQFGNEWITKTPWFATLTGRVGYAVEPTSLLYFRGGAAWVRADLVQQFPPGTPFANGEFTRQGWTLGGGYEQKFANNWSWFVEYSYIGGLDNPVTTLSCGVCGGSTSALSFTLHEQSILVGLNYRFVDPWGKAPVVAKY